MNYTLHQLKIFIKIVENQSVTRASEELFLTQPAVSLQLKKLQDQFDVPLTEVIGRKIFITEFGHQIAAAAQRILTEAETIDSTVMQYKGLLSGKIKIASVSTGKYVLPFFISDFINQNRGINFSIDVTNKANVVRQVENNETDFALVSVLPIKLDIETIPLIPNQLFLVGPDNSDSPEQITPKQLSTKPLLFREQGSATRAAMEAYLEKHNIPVNAKLELVSNEAVKQAVIAGLGYSIMPLIGMTSSLKNGRLKIIEMKNLPMVTHWNLIYLKSKRLSPAAQALITYMENNKQRITTENFNLH